MNLQAIRQSDNMAYLNFENDNNTYSSFDLNESLSEYASTDTDITKQNKVLLYSVLASSFILSGLNAEIQSKNDNFIRLETSFYTESVKIENSIKNRE